VSDNLSHSKWFISPDTEIQSQRKQADLEKKSYDDLVRERDILSKVCVHSTAMRVDC
jgi:hypothetical protein